MNTANNKRRQQTVADIRRAYLNLAAARPDPKTITVSDICKKAGINRTTFYAIYFDIDNLLEDIYALMRDQFLSVFSEETRTGQHSFDFNRLFYSIKENPIFYKLYFKLGFDFSAEFLEKDSSDIINRYFPDSGHIDYHIAFFSAGINAIIKKWMAEGCPGEPEEMGKILAEEYQKDNTF